MKDVNKNTEVNDTDKKLHISDVSGSLLSHMDRLKMGRERYGVDSKFMDEYKKMMDERKYDEFHFFFDKWDIPSKNYL